MRPSTNIRTDPLSTHRDVSVLVQVVSNESQIHGPLDVFEVPGGSVALLEHGGERIAPTGPLHGGQLGDKRLDVGF